MTLTELQTLIVYTIASACSFGILFAIILAFFKNR